jgi:hypothetical protein
LHPRCQFIVLNPGFQLRFAWMVTLVFGIQLGQQIQAFPLHARRQRFGGPQVMHRRSRRAEFHALVERRQPAARP